MATRETCLSSQRQPLSPFAMRGLRSDISGTYFRVLSADLLFSQEYRLGGKGGSRLLTFGSGSCVG